MLEVGRNVFQKVVQKCPTGCGSMHAPPQHLQGYGGGLLRAFCGSQAGSSGLRARRFMFVAGRVESAFFSRKTTRVLSRYKTSKSRISRCKMSFNGGFLGKNAVFAQTMLRIKDPSKSRQFYEALGMNFLTRFDFPELSFSLYFFALEKDPTVPAEDAPQPERAKWLFSRQYPTLELTHNWGTEKDPNFKYANGNTEPGKGYGHIGFLVDDLYASCAAVEKAGYVVSRKPGPFQNVGEIAFVRDPDDYWIELIQKPKS
jgi:lactoylglutathione lyase